MHRLTAVAGVACAGLLSILSAALVAGCTGGSALPLANHTGGSPSPSPSPSPSVAPMTQMVGVSLSLAPTTDPTYGMVLGYMNGTSGGTSSVVTLSRNIGTTVQFKNIDNGTPHTASNLGTWSSDGNMFPPVFNNGTGTNASPSGTDISSASFSTGTLNPGNSSAVYASNVPGVYVFGCAFHYAIGMRTVIIVQ